MSEIVKAQDNSTALISMIERAAINPEVDIEKMERLLEMHERIQMRQAETDFNASMTGAQSEMGRISADATNPQTRSRYATYGKLDSILRPVYTAHGFALSFDTGDAAEGMLRVICRVSHRGGFSREYHVDMPADGKGAKGGDVMTKTHATGAAMSYGMRYLLKMIFNVAIGEDDNDGNGPVSKALATITDEQAATIREYLEAMPDIAKSFLGAYRIGSVEELPAAKFAEAVARFKKASANRAGK
jgi:hypothetical protein